MVGRSSAVAQRLQLSRFECSFAARFAVLVAMLLGVGVVAYPAAADTGTTPPAATAGSDSATTSTDPTDCDRIRRHHVDRRATDPSSGACRRHDDHRHLGRARRRRHVGRYDHDRFRNGHVSPAGGDATVRLRAPALPRPRRTRPRRRMPRRRGLHAERRRPIRRRPAGVSAPAPAAPAPVASTAPVRGRRCSAARGRRPVGQPEHHALGSPGRLDRAPTASGAITADTDCCRGGRLRAGRRRAPRRKPRPLSGPGAARAADRRPHPAAVCPRRAQAGRADRRRRRRRGDRHSDDVAAAERYSDAGGLREDRLAVRRRRRPELGRVGSPAHGCLRAGRSSRPPTRTHHARRSAARAPAVGAAPASSSPRSSACSYLVLANFTSRIALLVEAPLAYRRALSLECPG